MARLKLKWLDEFVVYLIEKIKASKYMWKTTSPLYKNKVRKQQFWNRLVKDMNKAFNPNIPFTYGEIQQKWNNLKSYYTAENLKIYKAQKNGASAKDLENIQSSWKFKSKLDFLSTQSEPLHPVNGFQNESIRKSSDFQIKSSIASDYSCGNSSFPFNDIEIPNEFKDHTISITSTATSIIGSERSRISHAPMMLDDQSMASLQKSKPDTTKSNENSAFSVCISTEIDKLATDLQITAKKQIFSIIMDLQSEQLKRKRK